MDGKKFRQIEGRRTLAMDAALFARKKWIEKLHFSIEGRMNERTSGFMNM